MKNIFLLALAMLLSGEALAQDVRLPQRPRQHPYENLSSAETGFWCAAEIDAGSSIVYHRRNTQVVGLNFVGGYRFSEYLKAGVGVGVRGFVNNNDLWRTEEKFNSFPIFANLRGNILSQYERNLVPYWSLSVGGVANDGLMVMPTVGVRLGEQRSSFLVGLSYAYNELSVPDGQKKGYNFLMLKLGYEF